MNRPTSRRLFLISMVAISIFALTYTVIAGRSNTKFVKKGFNLEISMDGKQPFTLSVSTDNPRLALLPVKGARASAVKVTTSIESGVLKLNLLAVLDTLPEIANCDNIKHLKAEPVVSYVASEGDVIRVSDFESFGGASFSIKVTSPQAVCPEGACCCSSSLD